MSENILELKFDPNTIEHLGVTLYSKLPSVLSELISNSWDADADNVSITFIDNGSDKEIHCSDDGSGMLFDELNAQYLRIGRNRRVQEEFAETGKGRKVIGKKGLGKLSVFGICDAVEVRSVKNGISNHFEMKLEDIKNNETHVYHPTIIECNSATDDPNGTKISLKGIRRKTGFDLEQIGISLSKKFTILDQMKLELILNDEDPQPVSNELKYEGMTSQFSWKFPDDSFGEDYPYWNKIEGEILTTLTPLKDTELKGVYLISRGKIVNEASFYGARDTDQFHGYVTGYLHVDFIDEFETDVISTDRHSLNWEHDETKGLQGYLQNVIKSIGTSWKKKRLEEKSKTLKEEHGVNVEEWQMTLPSFEQDLSEKIINPVLINPDIDEREASEIIGSVIEKFENADFKKFASDISDVSGENEIPHFLKLIDEWKLVETKQFSDLAASRLEVIKRFEEYLDNDTKEVPTLHNFLKEFTWLLDPRILEFKDEVTFSKVLKEEFPDDTLDEKDRRIDFLCSNALGEVMHVIEIKRSKYRIDEKALDQAYHYGAFLKDKYGSESAFSKVVCYVIGGEKSSSDYKFRHKERTFFQSGEVYVKTYRELLEQSKQFHKEFIEAASENGS